MPKLKTRRSIAKRVRVTKRGKLLTYKAGKSHLQSGKSAKRRRHLRRSSVLVKHLSDRYRHELH